MKRLLPRKGEFRRLNLVPRKGQLTLLARQWASLRWASLPVTNRRWAAPLSAAALGMGLFAGVAIGPGVDGVVGAPAQVVEVPASTPAEPGPGVTAATPPPLAPPGGNAPDPSPSPSPSPTPTPTPTPSPAPSTPSPPTPIIPTPTPTQDESVGTPDTTTEESTPEEESAEEESTGDDDAGGEEEEAAAEELVLTGTVVHLNPAAGSYALVDADGQMTAVHAKQLPKAGTKLEVEARSLANGTYAEKGRRSVKGKRMSVRIGGLVTYSDPAQNRFTVSKRGASVLVHTSPAGSLAVPKVGTLVTVSARIAPRPQTPAAPKPTTTPTETTTPETTTTTVPTEPTTTVPTETTTTPDPTAAAPPPGCGTPPKAPPPPKTTITATKISADSESLSYGDFEGIVQGVCSSPRQLILSADGIHEAGALITFRVPKKIDLGRLEPGQVLAVTATTADGGKTFELTGAARDRGAKQANDAELALGDRLGG